MCLSHTGGVCLSHTGGVCYVCVLVTLVECVINVVLDIK